MINGWVQAMFVPQHSGILVFGGKTRRVFTGGNPSSIEVKVIRVPEMKMMIPKQSANNFAKHLQQALRNIKGGKYEKSLALEFSEGPIVDALDCVLLSSSDDYDDN